MSNSDQAMPVVQENTLLYQKHGQTCRLTVGTPEEVTLERLRTVAARLSAPQTITGDEQEPLRSTANLQHSRRSPTDAMRHLAEGGAASEFVKRPVSPLPLSLTSLIGREREIAAACTLLLRPEVRFLTLTGTGGVGKTRLPIAIATEMQEEFPDGVCFVSLAPIQDADLVLPTVVQALGLQGSTQPPLEVLQAALF